MRTGTRWSLVAALMVPLVAWAAANDGSEGEHDHERNEPQREGTSVQRDVAAALPEELREILNEEMRLIDGGMAEIGSALAAGDWTAVASIATRIEGSFILKQSLTPEQRESLHSTLPPRFVEMDRAFHGRAGSLAAAARAGDAEIATYHFSRLVEGCIRCHAAFAPGRFSGLTKDTESPHRE